MNKHFRLAAHTLLGALLAPAVSFGLSSNGLPIENGVDQALILVQYLGYVLLIGGVITVGVKMATGGGDVGRLAAGCVLGGGFIVGGKEMVDFVFEGTAGLLL